MLAASHAGVKRRREDRLRGSFAPESRGNTPAWLSIMEARFLELGLRICSEWKGLLTSPALPQQMWFLRCAAQQHGGARRIPRSPRLARFLPLERCLGHEKLVNIEGGSVASLAQMSICVSEGGKHEEDALASIHPPS